MNRQKLEEKIYELMEELKKVNKSFPNKDRLDGWSPKWADEKRGEAVAEKKIDSKRVLKGFESVGIWKEVYDLLILREKILDEMDKIAGKLDGPAVFTSVEFAENDEEL